MRRTSLLAPALLAACSTAPASPPVHGVTAGHKCTAARTEDFVGKIGNKSTGAAIKWVSNAAVLRWSPPNTMLTMDYREDRVTVWIDSAKRITKIRCG